MFTDALPHVDPVFNGRKDDGGMGPVRSIEGDFGEAKKTHDEGTADIGVLDSIEFDLGNVLIEDTLIEPEALTGELEDSTTHLHEFPNRPNEGQNDADEKERRPKGPDDEGEIDHETEREGPEIKYLRGTPFPDDGFVGHALRVACSEGGDK